MMPHTFLQTMYRSAPRFRPVTATNSRACTVSTKLLSTVPTSRPTRGSSTYSSSSNILQVIWTPSTGTVDEPELPLVHLLWSESLLDHSLSPTHGPPPLLSPLAMQLDSPTTELMVKVDEPRLPPGKEKHPDYYANVGDAIRTLREDIPKLFQKELNYSIYREDIVFQDPQLSFKGMKNYQLIFWSLRFHGRLFFSRIYVDVLRIWQPEDNQIKMRWRVVGIPRVWWKAEGSLDGISTYKLDLDGKIYLHSIDNVQLRDPPITNPILYGLNYALAPRLQGQSGQLPCPGSFTPHHIRTQE